MKWNQPQSIRSSKRLSCSAFSYWSMTRVSLAPANSAAFNGRGRARRNRLLIEQIVGLIGPGRAEQGRGEARLQRCVVLRQQRRRPVFVGDAEPGIGDLERHRLLLFDLAVGEFLQALGAEHADKALMQNVEAVGLGRAVARNQRERIERHRRGGGIAHRIGHGEEIIVVHGDGAAERDALAIVP